MKTRKEMLYAVEYETQELERPNMGNEYWTLVNWNDTVVVFKAVWDGGIIDMRRLRDSNVFFSKTSAEIALRQKKAGVAPYE